MYGDDVRNMKFAARWRGHNRSQVDELLERIAEDLDAGRAVSPLISFAGFRAELLGYDRNAVNAFLDQICRDDSGSRPAPQDTDPWRVFDQAPGTRLTWARTGARRRELRTDDQQTLVTLRRGVFSVGARAFTVRRVRKADWPAAAQAFALPLAAKGERGSQVVDDAGMAILYTAGNHYDLSAYAYIRFSAQRLLRFPVYGAELSNATMTAVDEAGNTVARYRRLSARPWRYATGTVEIMLHPEQRIADDLAVALALSAPWLSSYFQRAGTG